MTNLAISSLHTYRLCAMSFVSAKGLPVHSKICPAHVLYCLPLLRLRSSVPRCINLVRASDLCRVVMPFQFNRFSVARRSSYGHIIIIKTAIAAISIIIIYNLMLSDGFSHMIIGDSVIAWDAKDLAEAYQP